jgi:FK506-binding nuclear protein
MAAIDPSAEPQIDEVNKALRSTLKIIRAPIDEDDDEDDEDYDEDDDNIEAIKSRLAGIISDEDMSEDDSEEEKNGGPSDPAKTKKAKQAALSKKMQEELDEEMELDNSFTNGVNGKAKGKAKALDDEEISSDDESIESGDEEEVEEFVVCTLDPTSVSSTVSIMQKPH